MTALADIKKRLAALPPASAGMERALLVGISAERAIVADMVVRDGKVMQLPETLFGLECRRTDEFDGWVVRDCDAAGRWHDIEVL